MTRMFVVCIFFLLAACATGSSLTSDQRVATPSPEALLKTSLDYLQALPAYARFKQAGGELRLVSNELDHLGFTHLRYQQLLHSVPLMDAVIITHIKQGEVYRVDGKLADIQLISAQPLVTAQQAVQQVVQAKKLDLPFSSSATLVIATIDRPYDRLVWLVTINKALQRYLVLVDANNAIILREIPGIYTSTIN